MSMRTFRRSERQQFSAGAALHGPLDVMAVAREHVMDPRITRVTPGFDAPFQQAGLAGFSDAAMRIVARRAGCPYAITEALLDVYAVEGSHGHDVDGLFPLMHHPAGGVDRPLSVQLMGSEPDTMAAAAVACLDRGRASGVSGGGFEAVDVNLACPVRKVARKRRGGHWLADPDGAIEILHAVRAAVPSSVPTTVKLRRGSDDSFEAEARFLTVFEAAYDLGYAWATVHARTVEQRYVGQSRWSFLTDLVRRFPDRPIIGSGDVWCADDIFRMIGETGVAAVSVARGCIGAPWLFRMARDLMSGVKPLPPSAAEVRSSLEMHFELSSAIHGEERAARMLRKVGARAAEHHADPVAARRAFTSVCDRREWISALERFYPKSGEMDPLVGSD